ncbi:MAG: Nif11 family protein [Acidobacteria bacterium]|nr:Nif11 family protein [Acidobacteriota bacterium]
MAKRDAKKFVDLMEKDKDFQKRSVKRFHSVETLAQKRGLKFTRAELHDHLRERWGITKPPAVDDVDTCTLTIF